MRENAKKVTEIHQEYSRMFAEVFAHGSTKRIRLVVLAELSKGEPVACETIAAKSGISPQQTRSFLQAVGSEWDSDGRLIGFGLTLKPTPHRFEVNGKKLYSVPLLRDRRAYHYCPESEWHRIDRAKRGRGVVDYSQDRSAVSDPAFGLQQNVLKTFHIASLRPGANVPSTSNISATRKSIMSYGCATLRSH